MFLVWSINNSTGPTFEDGAVGVVRRRRRRRRRCRRRRRRRCRRRFRRRWPIKCESKFNANINETIEV